MLSVPCHRDVEYLDTADGGDVQTWRVAVNTVIKQACTANKE